MIIVLSKVLGKRTELSAPSLRRFRFVVDCLEQEDMAFVVRELADIFYSDFSDNIGVDERDESSPGLTVPDDRPEDVEHKTLDEF